MSINKNVYKKDDSLYRVVLVQAPELVYLIGLEGYDRESPRSYDYQSFIRDLNSGVYERVSDPYRGRKVHKTVSQEQMDRADRIYKEINRYWGSPVRKRYLLDKKRRKIAVQDIAGELGLSEDSVRRQLTRFFRRGMTRNALIPDYDKRGGPQNNGIIKNSSGKGLSLNDTMRENFRKAYYKYYQGTGNTLTEAHNYLVEEFYPEAISNNDMSLAPTFGQFYYWINSNITKLQKDRNKLDEKDFNNNYEILSSNSISQVDSVGGIFEMDDTQLDIFLVSSVNRDVVVGKPHLFSIVDVYSSAVRGFCLSLQEESWDTASRALNNCIEDKVEYCRKYGIKIDSWQWPCHYLPSSLLNDNGKVKSHHIEPITYEYGMDIQYAQPYAAKMKPKVERSHRKFNDWIKRKLPGASQKNEGQRGATDYAAKACLTLEELTKIIILMVLDFNQKPISKYPLNNELLGRDILPSPAELWRMSIECTGGNLIMVDNPDLFQILTLPHEERKIHRDGIHFHKLVYSSTDSRIKTILYNNQKKTVRIFYDILDIRKVFMEMDNKMYPLTLNNPNAFKKKISLTELNFFLARKNTLFNENYLQLGTEHLQIQKEIEKIFQDALQNSGVSSSKVNVEERKVEIVRDKVSRIEDKPEIKERRPVKNLYNRFDEERRKALREM